MLISNYLHNTPLAHNLHNSDVSTLFAKNIQYIANYVCWQYTVITSEGFIIVDFCELLQEPKDTSQLK